MEDLKSFILFVQLFLNRSFKPVLFQWLDEYHRSRQPDKNSTSNTEHQGLLDSRDACKLLKCNRHYLYDLVESKNIRFSRKGKALRFRLVDIQEYIDKQFDD